MLHRREFHDRRHDRSVEMNLMPRDVNITDSVVVHLLILPTRTVGEGTTTPNVRYNAPLVVALRVQKDVLRLQIPMQHLPRMHVLQCDTRLYEPIRNHALLQQISVHGLDFLVHIPPVAVVMWSGYTWGRERGNETRCRPLWMEQGHFIWWARNAKVVSRPTSRCRPLFQLVDKPSHPRRAPCLRVPRSHTCLSGPHNSP